MKTKSKTSLFFFIPLLILISLFMHNSRFIDFRMISHVSIYINPNYVMLSVFPHMLLWIITLLPPLKSTLSIKIVNYTMLVLLLYSLHINGKILYSFSFPCVLFCNEFQQIISSPNLNNLLYSDIRKWLPKVFFHSLCLQY